MRGARENRKDQETCGVATRMQQKQALGLGWAGLGRPKEKKKGWWWVCLTRTSLTNEMGQTVPSVRQGRMSLANPSQHTQAGQMHRNRWWLLFAVYTRRETES